KRTTCTMGIVMLLWGSFPQVLHAHYEPTCPNAFFVSMRTPVETLFESSQEEVPSSNPTP
ncbi:MAG: hypothetical protein AAFP00_15775, partial [Bacteroidota bacterium]